MWKTENKTEFDAIIADLINDPDVLSMKDLPQHSKTSNCLDHSIYVAYISFLACRRLGLDHVAAARAGLLHDFALKNWKEESGISRLWKHPHMALKNAEDRYELSAVEKDIIVKHMWPLTRPLPQHKESLIVSLADKFCALTEMFRLHKAFKVQKNLCAIAA